MKNALVRDPIWRESGRLDIEEGSEPFNFAEKKHFQSENL